MSQQTRVNAHVKEYRLSPRSMAEQKPSGSSPEYVNDIKTSFGSLMKYVCMRINCKNHPHEEDQPSSTTPRSRRSSPRLSPQGHARRSTQHRHHLEHQGSCKDCGQHRLSIDSTDDCTPCAGFVKRSKGSNHHHHRRNHCHDHQGSKRKSQPVHSSTSSSSTSMEPRQCVLTLNKHTNYFSLDLSSISQEEQLSSNEEEIPHPVVVRGVTRKGTSNPSSPSCRVLSSPRHSSRHSSPLSSVPSQHTDNRASTATISTASTSSTTLKPRSGKEYIDRRKLEDLNLVPNPDESMLPSPLTNRPNVFTFDYETLSSRAADSPRSPSGASTRSYGCHSNSSNNSNRHDYVNVSASTTTSSMTSSITSRSYFCEFTPPASPREVTNPHLNYADLDLSSNTKGDSGHGGSRSTPRHKTKIVSRASRDSMNSQVQYAQIDMVAMKAASDAGKSHAQFRKEKLDQREGSRRVEERFTRHRTMPSSTHKRLSINSRSGSKDRKFSAPS